MQGLHRVKVFVRRVPFSPPLSFEQHGIPGFFRQGLFGIAARIDCMLRPPRSSRRLQRDRRAIAISPNGPAVSAPGVQCRFRSPSAKRAVDFRAGAPGLRHAEFRLRLFDRRSRHRADPAVRFADGITLPDEQFLQAKPLGARQARILGWPRRLKWLAAS